jgi:hypothetical protein
MVAIQSFHHSKYHFFIAGQDTHQGPALLHLRPLWPGRSPVPPGHPSPVKCAWGQKRSEDDVKGNSNSSIDVGYTESVT